MVLVLCVLFSLLLQQSFQAITPPPRRPPPSSPRGTTTTENMEEVIHVHIEGHIKEGAGERGMNTSDLVGDSAAAASPNIDILNINVNISEAAELPSEVREESGGSASATEPNVISNLAANPDSYDMYKHLMEVQAALTLEAKEDDGPEVKTVKSALRILFETAWQGLYYGFMPEVARHRRSVGVEERSHLDAAITFMGAFLGMQNCSQVMACRTGRMAADRLSGAAVVVMMVESFVPIGLKPWFAMVKLGVMGRDEDCTNGLRCSINEEG